MLCFAATLADLDIDVFRDKFLPKAVSQEVLESENRSIEEQLAALGMFDLANNCPTFAGLVLFGRNPRRFMPGAYVQYVCFDSTDKTSNVLNEREFSENYCELLPKLESLLEMSVIKQQMGTSRVPVKRQMGTSRVPVRKKNITLLVQMY